MLELSKEPIKNAHMLFSLFLRELSAQRSVGKSTDFRVHQLPVVRFTGVQLQTECFLLLGLS